MTQSEQLLKDAGAALAQMRSALGGAGTQPPEPHAAAAFCRFVRVLGFLEARTRAMDAALGPANQLQQWSAQLNGLSGAFRNFLQNASQWQQLNSVLDQVLVATTAIPAVAAESAADQYSAALSDFRQRSDQLVKQAEDRAAKMEERVKALETAAGVVDARAKEIQGQVNQEKARMDKVVQEAQSRLDKFASEEQSRFSGNEQKRLDDFNQAQKAREAEAEAQLEAVKQAAAALAKASGERFQHWSVQHQSMADKQLGDIDRKLAEAAKILGVIVPKAMSGFYKAVADNEQQFANGMRKWATVFFIGATVLVVAVIANSEILGPKFSWGAMAFRVALAAVIFVPAFYFAKESANHRRTANRLRRIELELTALEPFLHGLPVDQKNEILKKKSDEYFGRDVEQGAELDGFISRYVMLGRVNRSLAQLTRLGELLRPSR